MRKETERKKERKERTLITFGKYEEQAYSSGRLIDARKMRDIGIRLLAEIVELERIMKDEGI